MTPRSHRTFAFLLACSVAAPAHAVTPTVPTQRPAVEAANERGTDAARVPGIYGLEEMASPEAAPAASAEPATKVAPAAEIAPVRAAKPGKRLVSARSGGRASFRTFSAGIKDVKAKRTTRALAALEGLPANSVEARTLGWAIALYAPGTPALDIARIAAAQPNWPGQTTLRTNMERAIIAGRTDGQALRVAFAKSPPRTSTGRLTLAQAELDAGRRDAATKLVRKVWREDALSAKTEASVLRRFGKLLRRDDHRARVERLVAKRQNKAARSLSGKAGYKRLVSAAVAVRGKSRDRVRRLDAVPNSLRGEPMYQLYLARNRRLADRLDGAAAAIAGMKKPRSAALGDSAAREAHRIATELLHEGKSKQAYRIAKLQLGYAPARRAAAAFQAGWIALRFRGDAATADRHFSQLQKIAERPISLSRAAYWRGRAADARGAKGDAAAFYKRAAGYKTTYYGQLAAEKLGRRSLSIKRTRASAADRARFAGYELTQAIELLEKAGAKRYARPLYAALARRMKRPGEVALLAARHEKRGDYRSALVVGKLAAAQGMVAPSLSHPLGAITGSVSLSKRDLALAYGVARQESAFQRDARSSADALGLMQLLPGTAKQVSRQIGLKYKRSRLTRDPAYNVRLGTTYLRKNRDRLGGSLPLALVAYNAGPTRAKRWSAEFGNPRTMSVDKAIDWVEMIPFDETRNYVQRVMSNHQVYRSRIMGAKLNLGSLLTSGDD